MATYHCPACRTIANLDTGCPNCGRPSDPDDARLAALDGEIAELVTRIEAARLAYGEATQGWQAKQFERGALVATIQRRLASQAQAATGAPAAVHITAGAEAAAGQAAAAQAGGVPPGAPPPAAPIRPRLGAPDTTPRTVQNLLFVLGAVLVVIGAIAFKVFAWSTIGVAGRASILGGATVVALGIPVLAARRHLNATAETFAAIGLAFVFIDGFGVWSLNLFGVADSLRASTYTGIVFAVVAVVALGYSAATRLAGPRFIAILAAQPVLVLVVSSGHGTAAGLSAILAATSVLDLLIVRWLRRLDPSGIVTALRVVAWMVAAAWLLAATIVGFAALIVMRSHHGAAWAALAVILAAIVLLATGGLTGIPALRSLAGGFAVIELTIALTRLVTIVVPDRGLFVVAAVTALLSAGVMALPARIWPKTGPRIGMYTVIGAVGLVTLLQVIIDTGFYATAISPVWRAPLATFASRGIDYDWQASAAVAVLTLALVLLLPRGRLGAIVPGVVLLAMAVPVSFRLTWWAPSIVDGLVILPLMVFVIRTGRRTAAVGATVGAATLGLHAFGFSLVRPVTTAATLLGIVILGVTVAALTRNGEPVKRAIAGAGLAGALIALPGAVASAVAINATHAAIVARAEMATVVVSALGLLAVRRWWTSLRWYALGAVTFAAIVAGVTPLFSLHGEPVAVYAALGLLVVTVAPAIAGIRGTAALNTVPAGIVLVPFVAWRALAATATVVLVPYAWLSSIWSGVPAGVGLSPRHVWRLGANDTVTMVLMTLAVVAFGAIWGRWRAAEAAVVPGAATVLVALAVAGAGWPTVPVVSLALGAGGVLYAALVPGHPALRINAAVAGLVALGAGLAGSLPTETSTLGALGAVFVVATVSGAAGRVTGIRVAGWLGAVASGAALVFAAMRALDIEVGVAAFGVLAIAAAAVFTGAALRGAQRRAVESRALAAAGHAGAFVALILTGTSERAAIASAAWGLVVGVRALWPGLAAPYRRTLASVAAGLEVLGWWFLLASRGVHVVDAYTVPLAVAALLAGWLALQSRPELRSWVAYGPALIAGFLPSIAPLLVADGSVTRRLVVGGIALATVLLGAWARLQAPVVIGGLALSIIAVHELVLLWQLLPTWIPLSIAGLVVLLLAVTYERRRRDMSRIRGAVARMT